MSKLIVPAPLWRRLLAAVYDGLVLIGLWSAAVLLEMLIRDQLLGLPKHRLGLQLYLLAVGLFFFGWSWTHGGQTLGMRAWRLQVRRLDGAALRWPIAAARFCATLLMWSAALLPALILVPQYAESATMRTAALIGALATLAAAAQQRLDGRRRAWSDWISGTEVVELPPKT